MCAARSTANLNADHHTNRARASFGTADSSPQRRGVHGAEIVSGIFDSWSSRMKRTAPLRRVRFLNKSSVSFPSLWRIIRIAASTHDELVPGCTLIERRHQTVRHRRASSMRPGRREVHRCALRGRRQTLTQTTTPIVRGRASATQTTTPIVRGRASATQTTTPIVRGRASAPQTVRHKEGECTEQRSFRESSTRGRRG